jgi:hypothetical protein
MIVAAVILVQLILDVLYFSNLKTKRTSIEQVDVIKLNVPLGCAVELVNWNIETSLANKQWEYGI